MIDKIFDRQIDNLMSSDERASLFGSPTVPSPELKRNVPRVDDFRCSDTRTLLFTVSLIKNSTLFVDISISLVATSKRPHCFDLRRQDNFIISIKFKKSYFSPTSQQAVIRNQLTSSGYSSMFNSISDYDWRINATIIFKPMHVLDYIIMPAIG